MKRTNLVLLVLMFMLATKAYAYDDHDFQVWNTNTEEFKVGKNAKAVFEEEFRWGDNAGEFYYHHYDAGFFYNLKKYLNIGGGYRHIYELKRGKFIAENAPYATATLLWSLKKLKFEDRSRLEYRHFDNQSDSLRYRNKITLKLPLKFTKLDIQPYISDEVFIGFSKINELNRNRFSTGFSMNLARNLKAEIYYMLQTSKSSGKWLSANILGTKVKISF